MIDQCNLIRILLNVKITKELLQVLGVLDFKNYWIQMIQTITKLLVITYSKVLILSTQARTQVRSSDKNSGTRGFQIFSNVPSLRYTNEYSVKRKKRKKSTPQNYTKEYKFRRRTAPSSVGPVTNGKGSGKKEKKKRGRKEKRGRRREERWLASLDITLWEKSLAL